MPVTLLKAKFNNRLSENCKNEKAKILPVPINDHSFSFLLCTIPEVF
jgi:hypothetical protein